MKQHTIAAILLLATLTCACTAAGATQLYVDETGWWIDPAQFNSSGTPIQDAINNAADGDRIYVYNGSYTENILVNKTLTLEGEGRDVVTVQAASVSKHVFEVTADYVNLSGFTATGATGNRKVGIYLDNGADHCNVSYNNVFDSNRGIYLYNSSNNILVSNIMTGNTYNFGVFGEELAHYVQNIDTSNRVDGKQVYYWLDQRDQQVPDDAGFVGLVNCKNITVRDLTLTKSYQGVLLAYSNNSRIDNVTAPNNYFGIHLKYSSNNTLANNNASENYCGIYLFNSSNNTLVNNIASDNSDFGIYLDNSTGNNITGNTASDNGWYGIELYTSCNYNTLADNTANSNANGCGIILCFSSKYNNLTNNTANMSGYSGILLYISCDHNTLAENTVSSNSGWYGGIFLWDSHNNNLSGNTANENSPYGIYLYSSSNNQIYNNYFDNADNANDYGTNVWNTTKTEGPNIIGGPYIGGNYWSDYTGTDGDGDGFGDVAHLVSGSNYDHLPLVREICGDVDGNMTVDAADLQLLLAHIFVGTSVANECAGDVDGNGYINIMDARLLLSHIADREAYPLNCSC